MNEGHDHYKVYPFLFIPAGFLLNTHRARIPTIRAKAMKALGKGHPPPFWIRSVPSFTFGKRKGLEPQILVEEDIEHKSEE